jgi:hypothetical protein
MISLANILLHSQTTTPHPPKLGFHIPPFASVPHLHLHILSGRYTMLGRFKYPIAKRAGKAGKGWSWFVEVGQVVEILERGGKVGVGRS